MGSIDGRIAPKPRGPGRRRFMAERAVQRRLTERWQKWSRFLLRARIESQYCCWLTRVRARKNRRSNCCGEPIQSIRMQWYKSKLTRCMTRCGAILGSKICYDAWDCNAESYFAFRGQSSAMRNTLAVEQPVHRRGLSANRKLCFWSQNHFTLIPRA